MALCDLTVVQWSASDIQSIENDIALAENRCESFPN